MKKAHTMHRRGEAADAHPNARECGVARPSKRWPDVVEPTSTRIERTYRARKRARAIHGFVRKHVGAVGLERLRKEISKVRSACHLAHKDTSSASFFFFLCSSFFGIIYLRFCFNPVQEPTQRPDGATMRMEAKNGYRKRRGWREVG